MHPKNYHVKVLIYLRKPGCNIISSSVTPTLGLWLQNCMLGVDKDQVWMGSEDSVIYIISMVAMVCNRQLTEHRAEVTGLALDLDKYR